MQANGNGSPGADAAFLQVRNLSVHFPVTKGLIRRRVVGTVKAVDDVSLDFIEGETLAVVGESGSGKTTLGRSILQLTRPTSGKVTFRGQELTELGSADTRRVRREMQIIFQDPYSSLNPRMTAGQIIGEPLIIHRLAQGRAAYRARVEELISIVGLNPEMTDRYPHEFSGGQRQRIGIARALAVSPAFIVCDEPVSALDVSIQAQIITLLEELRAEFNLTYLFIAHDLSVVRHIADRIAVMYLGQVMEFGGETDVFSEPTHPYTRALLAAAPVPDPAAEAKRERFILEGEVPSPQDPPPGCVFHTRCPIAEQACKEARPELREIRPGQWAACIKA